MHASLDFNFRAASKVRRHHLTKTQIQGEFREIDVCEPSQTQVEKIHKLSRSRASGNFVSKEQRLFGIPTVDGDRKP